MKLGIFSDLDLGGQGDFRVRLLWLNIRQPFSWWSQASLSVKWYEMSIGWNYAKMNGSGPSNALHRVGLILYNAYVMVSECQQAQWILTAQS